MPSTVETIVSSNSSSFSTSSSSNSTSMSSSLSPAPAVISTLETIVSSSSSSSSSSISHLIDASSTSIVVVENFNKVFSTPDDKEDLANFVDVYGLSEETAEVIGNNLRTFVIHPLREILKRDSDNLELFTSLCHAYNVLHRNYIDSLEMEAALEYAREFVLLYYATSFGNKDKYKIMEDNMNIYNFVSLAINEKDPTLKNYFEYLTQDESLKSLSNQLYNEGKKFLDKYSYAMDMQLYPDFSSTHLLRPDESSGIGLATAKLALDSNSSSISSSSSSTSMSSSLSPAPAAINTAEVVVSSSSSSSSSINLLTSKSNTCAFTISSSISITSSTDEVPLQGRVEIGDL